MTDMPLGQVALSMSVREHAHDSQATTMLIIRARGRPGSTARGGRTCIRDLDPDPGMLMMQVQKMGGLGMFDGVGHQLRDQQNQFVDGVVAGLPRLKGSPDDAAGSRGCLRTVLQNLQYFIRRAAWAWNSYGGSAVDIRPQASGTNADLESSGSMHLDHFRVLMGLLPSIHHGDTYPSVEPE